MVENALNTSITKTTYSFNKSSRFPSLAEQHKTINISHNTYSKMSDFDKTVQRAKKTGNQGFGFKDRRFTYCPSTTNKNHGKQAPGMYAIQGSLSPQNNPQSGYQKSSQYSFGLGRAHMKPLFLDELVIRERKTSVIGPAKYSAKQTFGRTGTHFSMLSRQYKSGARNGKFDLSFYNTEGERPGPGQYCQQDTVGQSKHGRSQYDTSPRFGFSTSQKFFTPTVKEKGPPPDQYTPKSALGMDHISSNKRSMGVVFGKDAGDHNQRHAHREQSGIPGAGMYERYSEFNPKYHK